MNQSGNHRRLHAHGPRQETVRHKTPVKIGICPFSFLNFISLHNRRGIMFTSASFRAVGGFGRARSAYSNPWCLSYRCEWCQPSHLAPFKKANKRISWKRQTFSLNPFFSTFQSSLCRTPNWQTDGISELSASLEHALVRRRKKGTFQPLFFFFYYSFISVFYMNSARLM